MDGPVLAGEMPDPLINRSLSKSFGELYLSCVKYEIERDKETPQPHRKGFVFGKIRTLQQVGSSVSDVEMPDPLGFLAMSEEPEERLLSSFAITKRPLSAKSRYRVFKFIYNITNWEYCYSDPPVLIETIITNPTLCSDKYSTNNHSILFC